MLQALQRQGARNRKRSNELTSSMLAQAQADRERLRASGGGAAAWSGGSRSRLPGTVWASRDYMMTMCRLCVCTVWCIEYIKYHKTTMNLSL